jgi:hypothetical protein
MALLLMAMAAGCSSTNKQNTAAVVPPATFPANYRNQVESLLTTTLTDPADFRATLIAAPILKQVGDNPHYIVCVQLNGHSPPREKVAIYLSGSITQFIDAPPGECAGAAYQPFTELQRAAPSK